MWGAIICAVLSLALLFIVLGFGRGWWGKGDIDKGFPIMGLSALVYVVIIFFVSTNLQ